MNLLGAKVNHRGGRSFGRPPRNDKGVCEMGEETSPHPDAGVTDAPAM